MSTNKNGIDPRSLLLGGVLGWFLKPNRSDNAAIALRCPECSKTFRVTPETPEMYFLLKAGRTVEGICPECHQTIKCNCSKTEHVPSAITQEHRRQKILAWSIVVYIPVLCCAFLNIFMPGIFLLSLFYFSPFLLFGGIGIARNWKSKSKHQLNTSKPDPSWTVSDPKLSLRYDFKPYDDQSEQ